MPTSHDIKNCKKCYYLRLLAVIFWSCGLIFLSLIPNGTSYNLFAGQDKLFHFLAYLLMAWLASRSLQIFSFSIRNSIIISVIYCGSLGAILELLQQTTTRTRTAELNDMLANLIGAISGCAIFCLQQKISSRNNANS